MPEHTTAAVCSGRTKRGFDRLAHSIELMVCTQYLHDLAILLRATDETSQQFDEAAFLKHPAEKDIKICCKR